MITLALICAGVAPIRLASAETLRCGSVLIEPGDDAMYVLEKCLEPASTLTIMQPPLAGGVNSNVYQIGLAPQRWRIAREWGRFRAVLAIGADGRVEDIEFERRRD
jgi:hypothetical protein